MFLPDVRAPLVLLASLPLPLAVAAQASGTLTLRDDAAGIVGPQIQTVAGDGSRTAGADLFLAGFSPTGAEGSAPLPGFPADGRMLPEDASSDGAGIVCLRSRSTWKRVVEASRANGHFCA